MSDQLVARFRLWLRRLPWTTELAAIVTLACALRLLLFVGAALGDDHRE